jgi:hypothetical protein
MSSYRLEATGLWYCGKHKPDGATEPADYVTEADAATMEKMVEAVYAHPSVALMRQHGGCEVSIVWERDGLPCKARLDKYSPDAKYVDENGKEHIVDVILDVKKCAAYAIDEESLKKSVATYYWDQQAYYYRDGLYRLTGKRALMYWIFIEDGPPFDVCPAQVTPAQFEVGRCRAESALQTYRHCLETGEWPGVSPGIKQLEPVGWLAKRYGVSR